MADIILPRGGIITCDEQDVAWIEQWKWRRWWNRGVTAWCIVHDQYANRRTFRRYLHREIAARAKPEIVMIADRIRVFPRDEDYTNVTRANLEIVELPRRRGRPKKDPRYTGSASPRARDVPDGKRRPVILDGKELSPFWNPG